MHPRPSTSTPRAMSSERRRYQTQTSEHENDKNFRNGEVSPQVYSPHPLARAMDMDGRKLPSLRRALFSSMRWARVAALLQSVLATTFAAAIAARRRRCAHSTLHGRTVSRDHSRASLPPRQRGVPGHPLRLVRPTHIAHAPHVSCFAWRWASCPQVLQIQSD